MEMVTRLFFTLAAAALSGAIALAAEHHAAPQAGVQSLDVFADSGRIHMLTGEQPAGSSKPVLLYKSSVDGGRTWGPSVRVDQGLPPAHSLRRGMDAQIAASGENVVAAWTTAGTDAWGSGPIAVVVSSDGGKTWKAGANPADDGSTTGHGFMDIAADGAGAFHITWLDSRDGKQGLRYARSSDGGKTWSPNSTLKAATCECCPNNFAVGKDGQLGIIFRDGSPRDMNVVLSGNGGQNWTEPIRAGKFDWAFNGCPHVGAGLAISRENPAKIQAAVWTGLAEQSGVYALISNDTGATWAAPHRLGGDHASHPAIASGKAGKVAIAWSEFGETNSVIRVSRSDDYGVSWREPLTISDRATSSSQPRVVAVGDDFAAFWTQSAENQPVTVGSAAVH